MNLKRSCWVAFCLAIELSFGSHEAHLGRTIESIQVFPTGLVPLRGRVTEAEQQRLLHILRLPDHEVAKQLDRFVKDCPDSDYAASLNLGLGIALVQRSAFSKAEPYFQKAFALSAAVHSVAAQDVAVRSLAELAQLRAKAGDAKGLKEILDQTRGRRIIGAASERIHVAREQLRDLELGTPSSSCAVAAIRGLLELTAHRPIGGAAFGLTGGASSLKEVAYATQAAGLPVRVVYRTAADPIPVPSIAHLKIGHYVVVASSDTKQVRVIEPGKLGCTSLTREVFDGESSGYFVAIPNVPLPSASVADAQALRGAGFVGTVDTSQTGSGVSSAYGVCKHDMPLSQYDFQLLVAGLTIFDSPVGYAPAVGPDMRVRMRYNQREYESPPTGFSNFGAKWTCNFFSYIEFDPSTPSNAPVVFLPEGGYTSAAVGTYDMSTRAVVQLLSISPLAFERDLPDGSRQVYSLASGATTTKNVYLTSISDAWGNTARLIYDTSQGVRLKSVVDVFGRSTVFSYGDAADPSKVTAITDPFGRSAKFSYNSNKLLESITDILGITSSFTYDGATDFVKQLSTPYGTSEFLSDENNSATQTSRYITAKDADGLLERVEFDGNPPAKLNIPVAEKIAPENVVNSDLIWHNAFYWDKKNYPTAFGNGSSPNYAAAVDYNFNYMSSSTTASGVLASIKFPLENRIWLNYAGQKAGQSIDQNCIAAFPSVTQRALANGSTISQYVLPNQVGLPSATVDPLGRMTGWSYDPANNIDLLEIDVIDASLGALHFDPVFQASNYTHHHPQRLVNAAGKVTNISYNALGQVTRVVDPLGDTTTFNYGAHGFLTSVIGASGQPLASFVADAYDRLAQTTATDGSTTKFAYDGADRIVKRSYGDSTSETFGYGIGQIEPSSFTDRQGRVTKLQYTPIHQLKSITDPQNRVTAYSWCGCGHLSQVTDPRGNVTSFIRDAEGRLIAKTFADKSQWLYSYQPDSGFPSSFTDALKQVKSFTFNLDGTLSSVAYGGAKVATSPVSWTYDPVFKRLNTMTDATGVESYFYYPNDLQTPGAGNLASITRSDGAATQSFGYDAIGRMTSKVVGANAEKISYDRLGRIVGDSNRLATFAYTYAGASAQLTGVTGGPVTTSLGYTPAPGTSRLSSLVNSVGGHSVESFGYTYNAAGAITTWSGAFSSSSAPNLRLGYDEDDWLNLWQATTSSGQVQSTNSLSYDASGNPLGWSSPASTAKFSAASSVNQIASVSEYKPNSTTSLGSTQYRFDLNGSTLAVQSNVPGQPKALTYLWDAENRVQSVIESSGTTTFTYGGDNRVHLMTFTPSKPGSPVSSHLDWDGPQLIAIRNASGEKQLFQQGLVETDGTTHYYTRDHLGSIRSVVNTEGSVEAQYNYSPWGAQTQVAGTYKSDLGFGGYLNGPVLLAPLRAYDPNSARWISRDPLGEAGGLNLYGFAEFNPVGNVDPDGLLVITGGASVTAGYGVGATGSTGFIFDTSGNYGTFTSYGGGIVSKGASAELSFGFLGSLGRDSTVIGDYGGPFYNGSGSFGVDGGEGSVTGFIDPANLNHVGAAFGIGIGTPGPGGSLTRTNTIICNKGNIFQDIQNAVDALERGADDWLRNSIRNLIPEFRFWSTPYVIY